MSNRGKFGDTPSETLYPKYIPRGISERKDFGGGRKKSLRGSPQPLPDLEKQKSCLLG